MTGNAAVGGITSWDMGNVLPDQTGLIVNDVIYSYTAVKDPADPFTVTLRNENAKVPGQYIFSETDDWTGLPGSKINKVVPTGNIDIKYWGDGEIATTGIGTVEEPKVFYTYRYDPCYNPQTDPSCPGFQFEPEVPEVFAETEVVAEINDIEEVSVEHVRSVPVAENTIEIPVQNTQSVRTEIISEEIVEVKVPQIQIPTVQVYNVLDDQYVLNMLNTTYKIEYEEEQHNEEEQKDSGNLEDALSTSESSTLTAMTAGQNAIMNMMSGIPQLGGYYNMNIPGGSYNETIVLQDSKLPDNRNGMRTMQAQDRLHKEMIDMQYNR